MKIKINEESLRNIVSESIERVLREEYLGVDSAEKYWDSDDNYITVTVPAAQKDELAGEINRKMQEIGFEFYTSGAMGDKINLSYKKAGL